MATFATVFTFVFFLASIHKIPYDIHIFAAETKMMSGGKGEWWWIVCDCAACIIVLPKFCFIDGVRNTLGVEHLGGACSTLHTTHIHTN